MSELAHRQPRSPHPSKGPDTGTRAEGQSSAMGGEREPRKAHGLTEGDERLVKRRLRELTAPLFDFGSPDQPAVVMKDVALEAARIADNDEAQYDKHRRKFDGFKAGGRVPRSAQAAFLYGHGIGLQHPGPINGLTLLFMTGYLLDFAGTVIWWTLGKPIERRRSFIWATSARLEGIVDFFDDEAKAFRDASTGPEFPEGRIAYRMQRAVERLSLGPDEYPELLTAWQRWRRRADNTFTKKPAEPEDQLRWYENQGDRLRDVYRAANEMTLPLITRERLVIASLSRWVDEYNAEVLSDQLDDAHMESVMESYFDESDEEGWNAERYPE